MKIHNILPNVALTVMLLSSIFVSNYSAAYEFSIKLTDQKGTFVKDAVVLLYPIDGQATPLHQPYPLIMAQKNKAFIPHVLPIHVGSKVNFPNQDVTRHHVYSFSKAKTFELRLYDGDSDMEMTFEKPGAIVLGCNIHDMMLGYIYVTDTPLFIRSNAEGLAMFSDLEVGKYQIQIWHPRLNGNLSETKQTIAIKADQVLAISQELTLKRERRHSGTY